VSSIVSEIVRKKVIKFSQFGFTQIPNILADYCIKKVGIFTTLFFQKPLKFGSVGHLRRGEFQYLVNDTIRMIPVEMTPTSPRTVTASPENV
jgi:hypothetical protein